MARKVKNILENKAGCRFAVCACHAHHFKFFGGIAEKGGAEKRIGASCVIKKNLSFNAEVALNNDGDSAVIECFESDRVTVEFCAFDADKKTARSDLS